MKVCFTEAEHESKRFFAEELSAHELSFVEELGEVPPDVECLSVFIRFAIDEAFLKSHPALRWIATRSSGFDHIDLAACQARGVIVSSVPTYGENTVAEHTFALLLALSRRIREMLTSKRAGQFSFEALRGFDLKGKTIGVVGAGRIGLHVIRIASAFSMEVLATDVNATPALADVLGFEYVSFEELLARSQIISLHVPLNATTLHMFNADAFRKCRRGVIIINTARGGLIDTRALREALESGQVSGAGLDVLEDERLFRADAAHLVAEEIVQHLHAASAVSPEETHVRNPERLAELRELSANEALLARPDVIFTPHVAFNSAEAVQRIDEVTVENIRAFAEGKPRNVVPRGE